jgi:hypothetical protein
MTGVVSACVLTRAGALPDWIDLRVLVCARGCSCHVVHYRLLRVGAWSATPTKLVAVIVWCTADCCWCEMGRLASVNEADMSGMMSESMEGRTRHCVHLRH